MTLEGNSLAELRAAALREGLDFLMVATISSKPVSSGPAQSVLVIHIMDICKGGKDWTSREVNHVHILSVQQGGPKEKEENPVPALIKNVLAYVNRDCQLTEMPSLSHDAAVQRTAALAKSATPLQALLELRYYQWKKALSDQEFGEYAAKVAPAEDIRRLATGTDAERRDVIDQWLGAGRRE